MWNVQLVEKSYKNGVLNLTVVYDNGTESFRETYQLDSVQSERLEDRCRRRIAELNDLETLQSSLVLGNVDIIQAVPDKITSDRNTFLEDLNIYKKYLLAVQYGLMDAADKSISDLKIKLVSEFNPTEHLNSLI